jgi:protein-tyrosine phosphatase
MEGKPQSTTGRIDVHSHLLPGVDDGCETAEESLACARELVAAGYTHSFCTPHVLPGFDNQTNSTVAQWTGALQMRLAAARIPLTLMPGGEINLWPDLRQSLPADRLATYGGMGRHCLVDLWADRLPEFFEPTVRWLIGKGLTVILAHPERMKAVQSDHGLIGYFAELGLLLQGNLQCLSDPPGNPTRLAAEKFLTAGNYYLLGSDLHRLATLAPRLMGLKNAISLVGDEVVNKLTISNPRQLLC